MLKSIVSERSAVAFPAFMAERVYMREFYKADGLPSDLTRWQDTVDAMLDGVDTDGPIYLMVDQKYALAGDLHRRGGVHIDGYWSAGKHGHRALAATIPLIGSHNPEPPPNEGHKPKPRKPFGPLHISGETTWANFTGEDHEAIILASNIEACAAYVGEYEGLIQEGGDCSQIDVSNMERIVMQPNKVYCGNVGMLHESLPLKRNSYRTLVRLNVPGHIVH